MINWGTILTTKQSRDVVKAFAVGDISARKAKSSLSDESFTEFNRVLKDRRTSYAKVLARKALRRRGVNI